ncbi:hypothetical protein A9P82_14345 [Arachidicoccus ginsenosidimutans]|uniref:LytR/AlgR family response regulator transcription factor n=1 Tax=Arachidicoccus sp. BS20 TaxID=1850526 RepID=UPI0007F11B39|nr:LytTR family DNA-binding domain-containing protein [Arachidicoccus sp. BS20]ANI90365.1 hypothetical protein A9P82_14345 [Arachidicoccus sp. BS20]
MLTATIIDNEEMGRIALRQKLNNYCPGIKILGEAADGAEGLHLIENQSPDIVFLDIEMPRMGGFEMLNQLPEHHFHLIFVTAYDQYAIRAIRFAAFDYLLKPVDIDELKQVVERAQQATPLHNNARKLEVLQENVKTSSHLGKIAIPVLEGLLFLNTEEIVHLEAAGNYTVIHLTDNSRQVATHTLKDFEELLPSNLFFRTHHSHIINLKYIKRYIKGDGGQIELTDDRFITVSRRKKEEFLKRFRQ